ncbi:hypothetical protein GUJ93_ZPchr0011g27465 [Zizania palustris]|uniref:non-specific serine/threonine protein kinase n=1 Tax=Zizania palustris TaxID=103762 RepID=A0A8J5WHS0_ZIZPA|nr:hypothetical protein GUJ93_ZPchr0011g27465 [Zizania palustris]
MVLWDGLSQAATIAQLAGVDAYGLIKMIVDAAHTAKRNKETCRKLARRVQMIGDLLQQLESTELIQHPETRNPVEELEETLRHTYMVIASCQESSYLHSCFMAGKQADQLGEVQSDITFYLQLFPLVGFIDTTRSWERFMSRAHPFCTDITNELHTVHHSEHEISTDVIEATELGDQGVSQSPEVLEEKQIEQTEITSVNLEELVIVDDVGKGAGWRWYLKQILAPTKKKSRRSVIGKGTGLYMSQILAATNNFSETSFIGQGGFGCVYKGKLCNGVEIAVKRHDTSSCQAEAEFMTEIDVIPKLRQKNIIELLAFYSKGKEYIIVYEYASNGSLDSIFRDEKKRRLLDWSKRLRIIGGMADGLLYMHNHSIVHRDIKPGNILLDHEMNPKISDFGLAMKLAPNATAENIVRGTGGYMDPQYLCTGTVSDKTDVYSFGVVLLEIISGMRWFSWYHWRNRHSNMDSWSNSGNSGDLSSTWENLGVSFGLRRAGFLKFVSICELYICCRM